MPYQTGKNVLVAYKVESAFNTPPGAGSGKQLRFVASPGTDLERSTIMSREVRSDGLNSMGRLGSRHAPGQYGAEISLGSHDDIYEAIMRSTWTASFSVTSTGAGAFIDVTANANNQITRTGSGSWITDGFRVGDVVRITNYSVAADNNINLRIKALTATVMTFHGTAPLSTGSADTTVTVTCLKKLKNPSVPTKRTFYVEEYGQDIDATEVFGGCKWVGMKIIGQPDGMATVEFTLIGASGQVLTGASAPYFTTPTLPTSIPLVFADAVISLGGTDIVTATSFELSYLINAAAQPVIGSTVSPDIFDNDAVLTGAISLIRGDLSNVTNFLNETELELHVLLAEPEAEPKDGMSLYVPRIKLQTPKAPIGGDGPMIETLPFITGKKESVSGYDDTLMTICSSAP